MPKPSMSLETITPETARRMLGNNVRNRRLKKGLVEQIARDILSGDFHITHQGIAFDNENNLIDGQHRLSGVVMANKAVEMYVTRGLHPDMMNVVDIGAKRTQADMLKIHSYQNTIILAPAATLYASFLAGNMSGDNKGFRSINNFKLLDFIAAHPEIEKAVHTVMNSPRLKELGFASVVSAFYAILHKKNRNKANEFFTALIDNYSEKRNHPALVLNEHILRKRAQGVAVKRIYLMAAIIKSWENFVANDYNARFIIQDANQIIKDFK